MRPSARLHVRLTAALTLPLLVAVAIVAPLSLRVLEDSWVTKVRGELTTAVDLLAEGDLPLSEGMLRRFASLQNADFAVIDTQGAVAFSTLSSPAPAVDAAASRFAAASKPVEELDLEVAGAPVLLMMRRVGGAAATRYRGVLGIASMADARRAATRAARLFAAVLLGASTLVATLGYFRVRGITRPLERVAAMADRIALGERDLRLDLDRQDEVGALARAVDSMASKLGAYERQLEARARVSALGELAARAAHEIRNPLTAIKLHLQLLAEGLPGPQARRVAGILGEVRRLELVADATLAIGQEQPLVRAPTDLGALIAEVIELMEPALGHRGIAIEARIECAPTVDADARKIKQVLLNLIVNAADALDSGGRIRVSASDADHGTRASLCVEDSGPGIAPERRAGLFEGGASGKPFGFGLGLVVTRDIVHQHGGCIRADASPGLGGARFVVELPVARAEAAVESRP